MKFLLATIIASLPLLLTELTHRKRRALKPETSRKISHVGSATVVLILTTFLSLGEIAVIAGGFCALMIVARLNKVWKSLYGVSRSTWGEIFFPLGVLLTALIATSTEEFICAIAVLGLSDTAAAIVGSRRGAKKIGKTNKTFDGSLSFALVTALVFLITRAMPFTASVIAVFIITLVEFVSPYGLDNITIPVGVVVLINIVS